MRSGESRCELQFQESLEGDDAVTVSLDGGLRRIGKGNGLRSTVARIITGGQDLDANAGFDVPKGPLSARESRSVASPDETFAKSPEPVRSQQDVDVHGLTGIAEKIHRHPAEDRVRNGLDLETARQPSQSRANCSSSREEVLGLPQYVVGRGPAVFRGVSPVSHWTEC